MKIKCLGFLLFSASLGITAANAQQQGEPALARVLYEFTHINDTLQPDKPHKEEMVLYIGQHASLYGSFAGERINQQLKKQFEDPAFDGNLTITGSGRTTPESFYRHPVDRPFKLLHRVAGQLYLVTEDYPSIDWQIADESKDIGGYTAQKATGWFGGRHYTAWFTTDVPFQAGPWKLHGLPGLVLEAADSRGHVAFRYAGFETLEDGIAMVAIPEHAIPSNKTALNKLVEAYKKNPQAAHHARSGAGAPSGGGGAAFSIAGSQGNTLSSIDPSRIKSINVKKDDTQVSHETNNPLELEPETR
ncbi:GLPGLI family protein [Parapedobacter deserti]|uniref:GLPGLI family protein n=1 Tax=Parapedobacter deserti TaxID=1912957 RepID=A0ABV7JNL2_9SPHI